MGKRTRREIAAEAQVESLNWFLSALKIEVVKKNPNANAMTITTILENNFRFLVFDFISLES